MTDTSALDKVRPQPGTATHPQHGDFIWYELLTSDADAAQDFYSKVVGWRIRSAGMGGGMDYRLLSARETQAIGLGGEDDVGGLMKLPEDAAAGGAKPGWLGYIGVEDVDAAAAGIKDAGGAMHMGPDDIPNVGRFAMVADPQGAAFYIMRGNGNGNGKSEAFKPMADGHCGWNELITSDQAAALDFYINQFGWEKGDAIPMGEAGDYRFINHHGEMIGAIMNRMEGSGSAGCDQPPMWNYYFRVPSIVGAVDTIRAEGGTITFGPQEVPGGDFVINALDPQGAAFGLVGPLKKAG